MLKIDLLNHLQTRNRDKSVKSHTNTAHYAGGDRVYECNEGGEEGDRNSRKCCCHDGYDGCVSGNSNATNGFTVGCIGATAEDGTCHRADTVTEKSAVETGILKKICLDDRGDILVVSKVLSKYHECYGNVSNCNGCDVSAVDLVESAEEMRAKKLEFTDAATAELKNMTSAIDEILTLSLAAFADGDSEAALHVEPLEQIIDALKEKLRTGHIRRLQQGQCSIETGFVWSDILTTLERTSDHCSNIAGCVLDAREQNLNIHRTLREMKSGSEYYKEQYEAYAARYL